MLNSCNKKSLQRTLVLIVLSVCVYCIHVKANIWPVVLTGDAIPGTANYRFLPRFYEPVINASGTIAFMADFVDPATHATGTGVFAVVGGQLTPVMLEGQPLPDMSGEFLTPLTPDGLSINDSGNIVFIAYLSASAYQGIFKWSNGVLSRVIDSSSGAWPQGGCLAGFNSVQINDQGSIAFEGCGGIYLSANGAVQQIALSGNEPVHLGSINNHGDIAFREGSPSLYPGLPQYSISIYSGGSINSAVNVPQPVPATTLTMQSTDAPSITDNGDIVFFSDYFYTPGFLGADEEVPNAIVRWSNGALQTTVANLASGGSTNAVFGGIGGTVQANQGGVLLTGSGSGITGNPPGVIGLLRNGQSSVVAASNEYVDNIGTLDNISWPAFDTQQGPLIVFNAFAESGTEAGIYAATAAQQYTLRFPHIADGGGGAVGGWRTTFVLANRSTTAANADLHFYDDNGQALFLNLGGRLPQNGVAIVVPALGVAQVQTQGGGPLTTGWALVQSDQNLTGLGIYGLLDGSGNSITEVGVPSSLHLSSMSVFAQNDATTSTGIALANPNSTAANVTLTLVDSNSTQLAQTLITIPPMGHLARYANQFFAAIPPGEFQGEIQVLSTQPLAGLTLRQRGSVFTSLPVIP